MTRRFFLLSSLGLLFFPQKGLSLANEEIPDETILRSLLAVLIPSDDTPGAKETHLYEKLVGMLSTDHRRKEIYAEGLFMVRNKIGPDPLVEIDWELLAQSISRSTFFRFLRWDAMRFFYADRASWQAVGYEGPPIRGYKEYDRCGS
ncbi:MAG: hypothetical protein R3297_03940 [Desulfobulbales bacterium]|nr:hypothetical protein [Desulfobulbales bacterium]